VPKSIISPNKKLNQPWLIVFVLSLALTIIIYFNLLGLKANYRIYDYIYLPVILLCTFALFKTLRSLAISFMIAASVAALIPLALLVYPRLQATYVIYCAERDPRNSYYDAEKGKAVIPCQYYDAE
jgi:hypothetical protein